MSFIWRSIGLQITTMYGILLLPLSTNLVQSMKLNSRIKMCSLSLLPVFIFSPALYASVCDVALTEKAYDINKANIRSTIMLAERDALCERQYSNAGEANSSARSGGFGVTFKKFSASGSRAKQNSNGKWDISEEEFCTSSARDLNTNFFDGSESIIASIAVKAWRDCVTNAQSNDLYMEYEISPDGNYFTGELKVTAKTGPLKREIKGITTGGTGKKELSCNIGGRNVTPEDVLEKPVLVAEAGTGVVCEKVPDTGVSVSIQTNAGSLPFVHLPSPEDRDIIALEELKKRVMDLENRKDLIYYAQTQPSHAEVSVEFGNDSRLINDYSHMFRYTLSFDQPVDVVVPQSMAYDENWSVWKINRHPNDSSGREWVVSFQVNAVLFNEQEKADAQRITAQGHGEFIGIAFNRL